MATSARVLDQKYRLGNILQQNERALIVAAIHVELREAVVIKVLSDEQRDPRFAARLRREARQSAAIRSEHAVRYLDIGHLTDGRPYVVMERLIGETLASHIEKRGPLPITEAVDAILQICDALAAAHVRGIVHRDLRTSNLFANEQPDGRMALKVLNFGTSRAIDSRGTEEDQGLTVAVLALDAPDYKAPEQIVARRDLDNRVDIWSLGVIAYELLTGTRPFTGASPQETVRRALSGEIAPATGIPPDLWDVVQRCLRARREERFTNVAEIADAIAHRASPNTAAYPKRIRRVLDTPPPADDTAMDGDEDFAPTMLRDVLALSSKTASGTQMRQAVAETDSGLPRIDDGRTAARSFPWVRLSELKQGRPKLGSNPQRMLVIAVFVATLLAALAFLMLLVPRFVVDVRVDGRERPAAMTAAENAALTPPPPPSSAVSPSAPAATSAAAAESVADQAAASSPTGNPRSDPARPKLTAPASTRSSSPPRAASGSSGDDPWGWER